MTAKLLSESATPSLKFKKQSVFRARCESALKDRLNNYLRSHPEIKSEADVLRLALDRYLSEQEALIAKNFCANKVGVSLLSR